jgi:phosphopantothenoylcysteine decarboxylase / phosphopantothenate---cysteine ligase
VNLTGKQVVLGVTGGIAAYKAADLCSRLVKAGADVHVVMTEAATRFVTPLTFQALTHRPVSVDMFTLLRDTDITHVSLGQKADLLVIAPATANTLAKLAQGLADNLLTTTALATRAPILIAPAMETGMWENTATQTHVATLTGRGMHLIGPAEGRLASGAMGAGRMVEPAEIVEEARRILGLTGDLAGVRVVISAGGTRERLDPVRFIGNRSSGKMGYALARAARDRGASVVLVSAPTALDAPRGVSLIHVESARDMHDAIMEQLPNCDALIMAAAVADYSPSQVSAQKIKKGAGNLTLDMECTRDILGAVAEQREQTGRPPVVVGFAAETENVLANAQEKLERKRLDLIVANDVTAGGSGFGTDTNQVVLLDAGGRIALPLLIKEEAAHHILDRVRQALPGQNKARGR